MPWHFERLGEQKPLTPHGETVSKKCPVCSSGGIMECNDAKWVEIVPCQCTFPAFHQVVTAWTVLGAKFFSFQRQCLPLHTINQFWWYQVLRGFSSKPLSIKVSPACSNNVSTCRRDRAWLHLHRWPIWPGDLWRFCHLQVLMVDLHGGIWHCIMH